MHPGIGKLTTLVSKLVLVTVILQACSSAPASTSTQVPAAVTSAPAGTSAPVVATSVSPASTVAPAAATGAPSASTAAPSAVATTGTGTATTSTNAGGPGSPIDQVTLNAPVTITLWHTQTGANATALNQIVSDFEKQYPNITVNATFIGNYTQVYQKAMASIQGGGLPDLAAAYESMDSDYASANAVVPLDPYVQSAKYGLSADSQADFIKPYWDGSKYSQFNNEMLSFPFTKSMLVMYYNSDLLAKAGITAPPQTWVEFGADCDAIKAKLNLQCYEIGIDASTIDAWIYSRGGTLLSADGKTATFNSQAGYDTFSFIQGLVKKGEASQVSQQYGDQTDFGAQKIAFTMGTSSGLGPYQTAIGGKFNWNVAVPPHNVDVQPVTVQYGGNITMFKSTPERQLASWLFIKYFTSSAVTAHWAAVSGYTPVRTSALNNPEMLAAFKKSPQTATEDQQLLQYNRSEPFQSGWQGVRPILQDALTAVINGKDPKTTVDAAATQATKIMSQ